MRVQPGILVLSLAVLGVVVACATGTQQATVQSADAAKPAAAAEPTALYRRVTETQYRHTIADVYGPSIKINARFEPEQRVDGLQAIGNAQLSITTSGMEQYISVARSIADQVLDGEGRERRVGCTPAGPTDAACAEKFIREQGQRLFRRPMSTADVERRVAVWKGGASQSGDFYKGLKLSLVSLLVAPEFLFRVERAEPDPAHPGQQRLDGYTKAARLSHLIWDTTPDAELMETARSGDIHSEAGLRKQIDRLIASPRMADGVRALFIDMMHFEMFDTLSKDSATYPRFSQAVADAAREETLRFLVDELVTQGRDYRDIFTAKDTFINRTLAAVYDVPYASADPWTRYTFSDDSERSGILTQVTFLALFSHPGRSSPTIRGVKLNEIFQCVQTPDPPPDVDFSKVQATEVGTVRTRLLDHMTNPGCSVCHRVSDPVGLTLEHFDGLGQKRTLENGTPIDVSATIGGKKFLGATGLGQYLHDSPLVPACLVRNAYYYGQGRAMDTKDDAYLAQQTAQFGSQGYRVAELYRGIASSPEFFKIVKPQDPPAKPAGVTAAIQSPGSSGGGQ